MPESGCAVSYCIITSLGVSLDILKEHFMSSQWEIGPLPCQTAVSQSCSPKIIIFWSMGWLVSLSAEVGPALRLNITNDSFKFSH